MSLAHGYTDSHPRQSYIMPCRQFYQPMPDAVPPQLGINPTVILVPHEPLPCPYAGHCSYPAPCHACYNRMATPSYYHKPPYPHFFQPPPFHCWGPYHGNTEPFGSHNELPYPPAYLMERPHVVREHHCCGCPNHVCDPKNEKVVKIEEHEPLDSDKRGENYSESSVPANWRNFPHPIVWIPPENNRNKEQGTHAKPRIMDLDTASQEKKPAFSSSHKEPGWNSWFPLFMDNYDHSNPGGEKKRSHNQHVQDHERNYPFPVIWIPSYDKQVEAGAEKGQQASTLESPESNFKVFPMQIHNDHNKTIDAGPQENYSNEVGSHHQDAEKNIHVKETEPRVGKNDLRDSEEDEANAVKKRTIDTPVDRVPGSDARKVYSSPTRTSKLPPVCLRVDPLPKKKGRNGSSRSPSPPGSEKKSRSSSDASSTDNNEQNSRAQSMNRTSEEHPKKKEVKVIEVTGETPSPGDNNSGKLQSSLPVKYPEEDKDHREKEEVCETKEDKGAKIAGDESAEKRSKELEASRTLSDEEAAMRIQSAYRGFQVRNWETLKKLKQIAQVCDEVTKVRKSIEELASSYGALADQGKLERQKVLIGESIMNLLLRLDTIQGLHPNLRDIRKSLARELVALQEQLDSLTTKSLEEAVDNSDTARNDECTVSEKEHYEEAKGQFEESLSVSENTGGQLESDEAELLKTENSVSEPSENACSGIIDGQTQVAVEDLKREPSASLDVESQQAALQHCTVQDFSHLNKIDDGEPPMVSIMEPTETNPERPTGEKDERLELATVEKSNYDSVVEDEIRLASDLGDGSNTKTEFLSKDEGTSALQPLLQADKEKGTMALDSAGVEPVTFHGPTLCSGDDDLISHGREPEVEAASKIHIAEEDAADSVLSEHDKSVEVYSVLNGHDKCNEGSDAVTSPENFGKLTIETQQLEVPKATTADSEVVDSLHLEQLSAQGPDDLSPAGSLKSEEPSQDASIGAEQDQRHEEGNSDETLSLPPPEEAQPEMLEPTVETCRDVNEDEAIVSADLSCNWSDTLNGEALAREKEESIAENVENIDLTTHVGEGVHEQGDSCGKKVDVAVEKSLSDEGAEQAEQSLPTLDDSNVSRPVEEMDRNEKLIKENEQLRGMMEKLMEAGKEQLSVISELTGRVKDLERRLARNKRMKSWCRTAAAKPRSLRAKSFEDSVI